MNRKLLSNDDLNYLSSLLATSLPLGNCLELLKTKRNEKLVDKIRNELHSGQLAEEIFKSYLPKGIKSVTGNFSRGEVIRICNLQGRDIAHGVSRYNSDALRRIAGHHSQQIDAILGYEYGPVAVHRDDMIIR